MNTKDYSVTTLTYDELSQAAQQRALNTAVEFFCSLEYDELSDEMRQAVDDSETMKTPWFVGEYMLDYAADEVLSFARSLEYDSDGNVAVYV